MFLQLHEFFVHSFEKNQFHLLDDFSRYESSGITFHPVKQPWMMQTIHHKITRHKYQLAMQVHLHFTNMH